MASKADPLEHTDGKVATRAIRLMNEMKDDPFFLAVGFYRPHVPATAPESYFENYPYKDVQLPDEKDSHLTGIPEAAFDRRLQTGADPNDLRWFKRGYLATITYVDEQIGRVVTALDELGLADQTIVVLWSDHGWMLGEHGQWEKRVLFEESVRVPLIIRAPGLAGNGQATGRLAELVDLYPTLAELCGIPSPVGLEGKSLVGLLQDPEADGFDYAFSQVGRRDVVGRSVRTSRWRYTEWDYGAKGAQLYDHHNDPKEYVNLAHSSEHKETVDHLSRVLAKQFRTEASLVP